MATLTVNTTLGDGAVTNAKLADMSGGTIKGQYDGAPSGAPDDLNANEVSTILDGADDPFVRSASISAALNDVTVLVSEQVLTGNTWTFDTVFSADADPGAGVIRFNNLSDITQVTLIYIDDRDILGDNQRTWIGTWAGQIVFKELTYRDGGGTWQARANTIVFNVTAVTPTTGYTRLTVSYVQGDMPTAPEAYLQFVNLDTQGVQGPASSADNAIARFDGTTGKLLENSTVLVDDNGKLGQVDAIDFDTTPTSAVAEGRMVWDSTEGGPKVGLAGGNVHSHVGADLHVLAYNSTGSPIAKGKVVRTNGSSGTRLSITLAQADVEANSADTIGIAAETIGNNNSGYVITRGLIRAVNTNAFDEGDVLYLSPNTAGDITNAKPVAPDHLVRVGYCVKKSGGAGEIYVDPLNGFELGELHDVTTANAFDRAYLRYNTANGVWRPEFIESQDLPADAGFVNALIFG